MKSSKKLLGGKPPKRRGRPAQDGQRREPGRVLSLLVVLAAGLFVLGGVAGFAYSLDRQLQGGILRQYSQAQRRADWVPLERLPRYIPAAFVSVVDPSFLEAGALRTGETGTTLARELTREIHLLPENLAGEARELVMGPVLERRASKEELLEIFLNRVPLGEHQGEPVYGIYHAAREYFEKEPLQLTLGETATLAGLLLPPRIQDPQSRVGAVGVRRNEVLRVLLIGGVISEESYRAGIAEPLGFQPGLDFMPMTRPADWGQAPAPIRLPEEYRPRPDSAAADSAAG